jgi:hypothetical protein
MLPKQALFNEQVENQCFCSLGLGTGKQKIMQKPPTSVVMPLPHSDPSELILNCLKQSTTPRTMPIRCCNFRLCLHYIKHGSDKKTVFELRYCAKLLSPIAFLGPPRETEETDDDYSLRCTKTRNQDNIAFETAWKNVHIKGNDTTSTITPQFLTRHLCEITKTAWQNKLQESLSTIEIDRFDDPGMHPSTIGDLWDCGERKLQRLFSQFNEMEETERYLQNDRTVIQQARTRGKLNQFANVPL